MNEKSSNLSWYPLFSPTFTDSDLLFSNENVYLETSTVETHTVSTFSDESRSQTGGLALGNQGINFPSSEHTTNWHRKLSDGGTAAGGK